MKSKTLRRTLAIAMSAATLLTSAVSLNAFAANDSEALQSASESDVTYVENHSVIDCSNYFLSGYNNYYYNFLIKVPKGASLESVTLYDIYGDRYINLGNLVNTGYQWITFEYSNQDGDFYMFNTYVMSGVPGYVWEHFGIKLFYDNGDEHYMATNTSNGSTKQGPGYILTR